MNQDQPPEASAGTEATLGRRAAQGAASTGAGLVTRVGLQVVTVVVLGRLLSPAEYGLIAMVLAVIGVGELLRDSGLGSAAIAAATLSVRQRSNLFWSNTVLGLSVALVVAAGAPLVAMAYGQPKLTAITQILAVTFWLNAMMTQYRASLLRAMRFAAVAAIDVVAPASALVVAVVAAAAGAGYWALVAQQLTQSVVALVAFAVTGRWLPSARWHRGQQMRQFYTFGIFLLGSQLVGYVANNIDAFIIGRRFGAADTGLYNRAFQLLMNPLNQVRTPSTTVALPVLSRAGRTAQFDRIVRAGQLVLGYPVAVALAIVVGTAYPLVAVMLGGQWTGVPPVLRFLAVAGVMQTMAYVGYWVYLSRSLTRQLMAYTTVTAVLKITLILVGSTWGPVGVAGGYALAATLEWPLSLWWLSRITAIPTRALYGGAGRILSVGTVTGAAATGAVWLVGSWPSLLQVLVGALAGVGAAAVTTLVPRVRRDLDELVHALRAALSRRGRTSKG
ncbi:MAG: lipopolysaccharide biosynthesis protein [Micrococcales bacterium]|nr:lipopolysaccharide biosynthesis protein [Micrococcales bacterium]